MTGIDKIKDKKGKLIREVSFDTALTKAQKVATTISEHATNGKAKDKRVSFVLSGNSLPPQGQTASLSLSPEDEERISTKLAMKLAAEELPEGALDTKIIEAQRQELERYKREKMEKEQKQH